MKIWTMAVVIVTVVSTFASGAPQPSARERAKAHYKAAVVYHRDAKFDQAIEEYLAAYQIVPLPPLLFNVAQAYRLKGDKRNALEYYRQYVAGEPNGELAGEARAHIEKLLNAIEEDRRTAAGDMKQTTPSSEPAKPIPVEAERVTPEATTPEQVMPKPVSPADAPSPQQPVRPSRIQASTAIETPHRPPSVESNRSGALRIAGFISGGAGVASIAGGLFSGLRAKSLAHDVATTYDEGKVSDGEAANRTMLVLYGVGTAAVVAGGILFYLAGRSDEHPARVVVSPMVTRDGATVSVEGIF